MRHRVLGISVLLLAGVVVGVRPANATPITYTETTTATGSLGGVAFNSVLVTLTLTGDTTGVHTAASPPQVPLLLENGGAATVAVTGFAPATFTDSIVVFDSAQNSGVGISDLTKNLTDILDDFAPAFASYGLNTSIGPITGNSAINGGFSFPTTGGDLILTAARQSTFTAVTGQAVPEPASMLLLGTGLIGMGARRWRSRRQRG